MSRGVVLPAAGTRGMPGEFRFHRNRGATLIEAVMAASIIALFLGSVFTLNSRATSMLRSAKEAATASQCLQERIEQMRICNWVQLTDAGYLSGNIFNAATDSAFALPVLEERVTIEPYPAPSLPSAPIQLSRQNGTVALLSDNPAMSSSRMVRIELRLTWKGGSGGRTEVRETASIVAKGGITK